VIVISLQNWHLAKIERTCHSRVDLAQRFQNVRSGYAKSQLFLLFSAYCTTNWMDWVRVAEPDVAVTVMV
jgi:hypothetical protein